MDVTTGLLILLGGLAGSLHCVGMCGGIPLALAANARRRPFLTQILYNLGRLNSLVAIGAVSGVLGAVFVEAAPMRFAERFLAILAGGVMAVVGLEMLGLIGQVSARGARLVQASVGRLLRTLLQAGTPAAPLVVGVFNAFLPCQLIYAFAARAASTGSPVGGMLTMFWFGLGTVPVMLLLGAAPGCLSPALRARISRLSGVLVLAFAAVTLLRGIAPDAHLLGHAH